MAHPARRLLLLRGPQRGGPGPVDARQRHRDRVAGQRLRRDQRCRAAMTIKRITRRRHQFYGEGARGCRGRPTQRAVQPDEQPLAASTRQGRGAAPRRLPAVGRGVGPAEGQEGQHAGRELRQPHDELGVPRRQVRQRRTPTPPRATSSPPTACWCCGSRSATPATPTRRANPVPETKLEGKGEALLFHDGQVVKGTWSKYGLDGPLKLTRQGELTVPAGNTWIELVPRKGTGTSAGRT